MSRRWKIAIGIFAGLSAAVVALVILFDWNWFRGYAEAQASAELGRRVEIVHLDVKLARDPLVIVDGFRIGNPPEFPEGSDLANFERMEFRVDLIRYLKTGTLFFPEMTLQHPVVKLETDPAGKPNWLLGPADPSSAQTAPRSAPEIGRLTVHDGQVQAVDPKSKTKIDVAVHTEPDPQGGDSKIVASGNGQYMGAQTKFEARTGSLAAFRDVDMRYPVDLVWDIGQTHIKLTGTVQNRTNLAGVDGKLELSGPDMSQLYPILGLALPPTPAYKVVGHVWQSGTTIHYDTFDGTVGSSDLSGSIAVDTGGSRPVLVGELNSGKTLLADLGGFIGAAPGKADAPNASKERKAAAAKTAASPKSLPADEIDLGKINEMDAHLVYRAKRLESDYLPVDDLMAKLDLENGRLQLKPLAFGVGKGRISMNIDLDARKPPPRWTIDADFRNIDLRRILEKATGSGDGSGLIGGRARIVSTGGSAAEVLANGDGHVTLAMTRGQISAVLTELAGLDLLEALGFSLSDKNRQFPIRCMVADGDMQKGVLRTNTLVIDTTDTNIGGNGWINFRDESIGFRFEAHPKDVSMLTFRAPVNVGGTLKAPRVGIDPAATGARAAAMVALGALLTPLAALIPTIELGLGQDSDCAGLISQAQAAGKNPPAPRKVQASRPDPQKGQKAQRR